MLSQSRPQTTLGTRLMLALYKPSSDHTQYRLSKFGTPAKFAAVIFKAHTSHNCELFVHMQLGARSCSLLRIYKPLLLYVLHSLSRIYKLLLLYTILNHMYISLYVSGHTEFVHAMSDSAPPAPIILSLPFNSHCLHLIH